MKKIVTLTLNPSLDETLITRHMNVGYYNHVVESKHLDASGRGVNVSRALDRLETPTHAVIVLGDDPAGHAYKSLIEKEAFATTVIRYPGPTRSDTIIVDKGEENETHIVDEDSVGPRNDMDPVISAVKGIVESGDVVVCAGVLPRDTSSNVYAQVIDLAHEAGAEVVLMTSGEAFKQAQKAKPETVVLLQREAEGLFNYPVRTLEDIKSAACKLMKQGCKRIFTVMNDYTGVVLVQQGDMWVANITDRELTGTDSGVVDAMLAAYLTASMNDTGSEESCKIGAAALSFAAEQIGNEFGNLQQIEEHLHKVSIHHISWSEEVSA